MKYSSGVGVKDQVKDGTVVGGKMFVGRVVSSKSIKTVVVRVERKKMHPRYKKQMKWSKRYACHDEEQVAKEGDWVKIGESRPYSKMKKFCVLSVLDSHSLV